MYGPREYIPSLSEIVERRQRAILQLDSAGIYLFNPLPLVPFILLLGLLILWIIMTIFFGITHFVQGLVGGLFGKE